MVVDCILSQVLWYRPTNKDIIFLKTEYSMLLKKKINK